MGGEALFADGGGGDAFVGTVVPFGDEGGDADAGVGRAGGIGGGGGYIGVRG